MGVICVSTFMVQVRSPSKGTRGAAPRPPFASTRVAAISVVVTLAKSTLSQGCFVLKSTSVKSATSRLDMFGFTWVLMLCYLR